MKERRDSEKDRLLKLECFTQRSITNFDKNFFKSQRLGYWICYLLQMIEWNKKLFSVGPLWQHQPEAVEEPKHNKGKRKQTSVQNMKEFSGTISRQVIIIKPRPLYPWERTRATSRSGRLARAGIRTPDRSASSGVIKPNGLCRVKTKLHGQVKRNSLLACSPTW